MELHFGQILCLTKLHHLHPLSELVLSKPINIAKSLTGYKKNGIDLAETTKHCYYKGRRGILYMIEQNKKIERLERK
jgi:hypothetical protein